MGIYDRDYMQEPTRQRGYEPTGRQSSYEPTGRRRGNPLSGFMMTTNIIIINVILFLANALLTPPPIIKMPDGQMRVQTLGAITEFLKLQPNDLLNPLTWYQFLTYGFVHDTSNLWHIIGNMLGLFFLGYEVENRLGRKEFLRFYLATIIFGGICYSLANFHIADSPGCVGASGGVVGVIIMYAMLFPHRTLLIYGIFPMPAWLLGFLIVGGDLYGAIRHPNAGIAFAVHLAGAAFAFLYHRNRWHIGRAFGYFASPKMRKPTFKIFQSEEKKKQEESEMAERLDVILIKYSRYGEASLSQEERDFLQKASEEYRKKLS